MSESEKSSLRELARLNICPNCGQAIPPGKRQVYGEAVFCGLDCVAVYNGAQLVERHKKLLEAAKKHQNS